MILVDYSKQQMIKFNKHLSLSEWFLAQTCRFLFVDVYDQIFTTCIAFRWLLRLGSISNK